MARSFRRWLKKILPGCEVWMSDHSIGKGTIWRTEIAKSIRDHWFGVLFLTQKNKSSEWILFEAGGLYKGLSKARIAPLLIDLQDSQLDPPLSMFECTALSQKGDMLKLVQEINRKRGRKKIRNAELQNRFDANWYQFASGIRRILKSTKTALGAKASTVPVEPKAVDGGTFKERVRDYVANTFWVGADLNNLVAVIIRGGGRDEMLQMYRQASHHLRVLRLKDSAIYGRLRQLYESTERSLDSDWTQSRRIDVMREIHAIISAFGHLIEDTQPGFSGDARTSANLEGMSGEAKE